MPDPVILPAEGQTYDAHVPVLVVGAGAAGVTAGLAARGAGADVMLLERDDRPLGSTSMSSGFVPAAGSAAQARQGIDDTAEIFGEDIRSKAGGLAEPALVDLATREIAPTLDWLETDHGIPWQVLDDFLYPGHRRHRMHAVPERTGAALLERLLGAAASQDVAVATGARVTGLFATPDGRVHGTQVARSDGTVETIGCDALILACCGYGANRDLVTEHIPVMATAPYWGHPGNTGDAIVWGQALGGETRCLSGAQGHGSLAHPHGALITWALMMEGGIQVNADGQRFSNEHRGYSEQSVDVLAQPGGVAWCIFDKRLYALAQDFQDFRDAEAAGAVLRHHSTEGLAAAAGVDPEGLTETLEHVRALASGSETDGFGRDFTTKPGLGDSLFAVRVTGALFHTQGGLMIGGDGRVVRPDGRPLPNLFAAGGAACGVSGQSISGYLSGNGLLTALAFGRLAGHGAASISQANQ